MPSYQFDRPIPGQSLTSTPRNAPYERPPEIVDPEDAILVHLKNLNKPEAIEGIIEFVNEGFDIQTLVEGITRSAVLSGIHTIDVSLIVAPVIHEYIRTTLDMVGVEYDEGFEESEEAKKTQMYSKAKARAARDLLSLDKEVKNSKKDMGDKYQELMASMSDLEATAPDNAGEQTQEEPAPAPRRARPSNPDQMELPLEEPTPTQQAEPEGRTGLMSRRA